MIKRYIQKTFYIITVCFILFILYKYIFGKYNEYFALTFDNTRILTTYERDNQIINDLFEKWNFEKFPTDRTIYTKVPNYIQFPWENVISRVALSNLLDVLSNDDRYVSNKLSIVRKMYNIYWRDEDTTRHILFNTAVRNSTLGWIRRFGVYVKINNINLFLTEENEYIEKMDKTTETELQENILVTAFSLYEFDEDFKYSENSPITAYNDPFVRKQDSLYEMDTKVLTELFNNWNIVVPPVDYKTTYQNIPYNIKFPWQDIISKIILANLKDILSDDERYNDKKISKKIYLTIVKSMYNIYWKDDDENNRHLIFDTDIRYDTAGWVRTLSIYIKITNIKLFLTDTGEYIEYLDNSTRTLLQQNTLIVAFFFKDSSDKELSVSGIDAQLGSDVFKNYYNILNTLHLMDPYITSRKYVDITDKMKDDFQLTLNKEVEKPQEGTCYNIITNNPIPINLKEECESLDHIWDSPPKTSSECPYYLFNKNYPNNFGGLLGDKCQLPKNMKLIGYTNFSANPLYKPLCYNCKQEQNAGTLDDETGIFTPNSTSTTDTTLGFCCDDQMDNIKYPNLLSPDYAFYGDSDLRQKYSDELSEKKMSIV